MIGERCTLWFLQEPTVTIGQPELMLLTCIFSRTSHTHTKPFYGPFSRTTRCELLPEEELLDFCGGR